MKQVLLKDDKVFDSYEEKKRDKTIIYKLKKDENQLKPDTPKDNKNER